MFDEGWHQIRLLVTEDFVTLYIDDQEIEMKPLHPVLGIYISGLTQIGKYSGKEETVQAKKYLPSNIIIEKTIFGNN